MLNLTSRACQTVKTWRLKASLIPVLAACHRHPTLLHIVLHTPVTYHIRSCTATPFSVAVGSRLRQGALALCVAPPRFQPFLYCLTSLKALCYDGGGLGSVLCIGRSSSIAASFFCWRSNSSSSLAAASCRFSSAISADACTCASKGRFSENGAGGARDLFQQIGMPDA